jgi:hypothetical protein
MVGIGRDGHSAMINPAYELLTWHAGAGIRLLPP